MLNKNFLSFNAKGINDYANRHYLAYMVNVYLLMPVKRYFNEHDIDVNDDDYALCCMVQWIWRSAIRNGEPITLYLPSSRMRKLLTQWMEEVEREYAKYEQMNQNERPDDTKKESA
ncbi:MAG: hypothetical protein IJL52_07940 [Clostridia bacterium]|nr:hypothetical protein [Clostridia bacterium]